MPITEYLEGLVQIRPQWHDSSASIHECVLWWQGSIISGNYSGAQLLNLQATFDTAWNNLWHNLGSPSAHYIGSVVTDWSNSSGLTLDNASYTPVVGGGLGEQGLQVAALISLKEVVRYKGGHGRVYIPCLGTNISTDGRTIDPTDLGVLQTQIGNVQSALGAISSGNGGPFGWRVYHQRIQVVPHTTPPTYIPAFARGLSGAIAQSVFATQRRRLRKAAHR